MTPDAAVEAAARAHQALCFAEPWESLSDYLRDRRLEDATLILEAAAPHMMADALEEERNMRVRAERELKDARAMVAMLVLKAGGKVSVGRNEIVAGYQELTTFPNVISGGIDIEAR